MKMTKFMDASLQVPGGIMRQKTCLQFRDFRIFLVEAVRDFSVVFDPLENMQSFKIPNSMTLVSLQCHNNNRIICNSLFLRKGYDSYVSYRPRPLLVLKPLTFNIYFNVGLLIVSNYYKQKNSTILCFLQQVFFVKIRPRPSILLKVTLASQKEARQLPSGKHAKSYTHKGALSNRKMRPQCSVLKRLVSL